MDLDNLDSTEIAAYLERYTPYSVPDVTHASQNDDVVTWHVEDPETGDQAVVRFRVEMLAVSR